MPGKGTVPAAGKGASTSAGKGATTRAAIVDRAVALASTEGLEGLTIGRLAGDLDMSKSGLFAHFGSKEELQLAAVHEAARRFYAEVIEPAQDEPEGEARLRAYCERYIDYLERRVFPGGCFWASAAPEFDDRPGPVRDAIRAGVAGWLGELQRQAQLAGAREPEQLVFELYSVVLGANASFQLMRDARAFERARTAMTRLLDAELPAAAPSTPKPRR